jgi:phosphate uptake regulator
MRLRGEVLESGMMLTALLSNTIATAALHAHPQADIEKAGEHISAMFFDALSMVPYMTQGKSGKDMLMEERVKAIQKYQDRQDRLTKNLQPKPKIA